MVSIAYRLRRKDPVQYRDKTRTVGLGGYSCGTCKVKEQSQRGCHRYGQGLWTRGESWAIDYNTPQEKISFCPFSFNLDRLANQVYQCLRIFENGGLAAHFDQKVGRLKKHTVLFYYTVLAAERRFNHQKDVTYQKMVSLAKEKNDLSRESHAARNRATR